MGNDRKLDHIQLAFKSQTLNPLSFGLNFEPMLSAHPTDEFDIGLKFLGKNLKAPLWISSMTGGTKLAKKINENLARACGEFGIGMGLGSCRPLLEGSERLSDFAVKPYMRDYPLYANLGIAQIEQVLKNREMNKVNDMMESLQADGLFIHVNPLQEWMQPEGDIIQRPPIETIEEFLKSSSIKVIVKEVGQGFGPKSFEALTKLPISGIEFAAFGGTNFTKLEHSRHSATHMGTKDSLLTFAHVGHTASEMVEWCNNAMSSSGRKLEVIVSGGIKDVLTGYCHIQNVNSPAVIGMASQFLKYAMDDYETLQQFVKTQVDLLKMATCYLHKE